MLLYLLLAVLFIVLWWIFSMVFTRNNIQPVLYYKQNDLSDYLINNCKTFTRPFRPPVWLQNRHVQTILPALLNKTLTKGISFKREFITVDDGENIAIDWAIMKENTSVLPKDIIVVLPGMTASAVSFSSLCYRAMQQGFRALVFNKRGHGGSRLSRPLLKGFGDSSDLNFVLKKLRKRYPDDKIGLIGSSAGSALLASYCSTYVDDSEIQACIHFSPGYESRKLMEDPPFSGFYEYILLQSLKYEIIWPNIDCLSQIVDRKKVKAAKTIWELERDVYCEVNGYKDMDEYWENNDMNGSIWGKYSTPTLCISGLDDPICVAENIPYAKFHQYENAMLMTLSKGGHCGFIENLSGFHWADDVMVDYIKHVFRFIEESCHEDYYAAETVKIF